jgi:DNA repair protein RecN (Recombination protein N)
MEPKFYLKQLIIQNFATFKNQTIHFIPGLNTIVGETGSGKSLVLDALELILGGRADKKVVRRGTDFSLLEASFRCQDPSMRDYLSLEGYPLEENEDVVIKRVILKNGTTKNYINHLACTVSFLANFARRYIDIVGQFENQRLLSETYQLQLLDQFGQLKTLVDEYQHRLRELKTLIAKEERLIESNGNRDQRLDYLAFQLQEIEKLNPSSQDEEDLLKKKLQLVNFEKNQKTIHQIEQAFEGSEERSGLLNELSFLQGVIKKGGEQLLSFQDDLNNVEDLLKDLFRRLEFELRTDVDGIDLETVLERLDLYQRLKKKFGGSVDGILQNQKELQAEKMSLEELDFNLELYQKEIKRTNKILLDLSRQLHVERIKSAQVLEKEITNRIQSLRMLGATIKIDLTEAPEFNDYGRTKISLMAETNTGEGYFKIKDIASGGELSRILLAVRQILSSFDAISIFLFDEIDTGIGGETANSIGKALLEVASNGQVIAITHLPQIAQFSENLIIIQKDVLEQNRTESSAKEVMGKLIQKEVRAMAQLA